MKSSKEWPTKESTGSPRRGHTSVCILSRTPREKCTPDCLQHVENYSSQRGKERDNKQQLQKQQADGDLGCVSLIHTTTSQINQLLPGDGSRGL